MSSSTLTVPRYEQLRRRTDAPPGSSWYLFGPDDQLGTLNFLTPRTALDGAALVKRGRAFNLDYPLNTFVPSLAGTRPPTAHHIFANNPDHRDDWLDSFYLQSTSQVDGLRHIRHPRYGFYGGVEDAGIDVGTPALGIQLLAEKGIVGRGILLDAVRYFDSVGEPLAPNAPRGITPSDLDGMAEHFGVEVRSGDILLLRTGFAEHWLSSTPEQRAARTADQACTSPRRCSPGCGTTRSPWPRRTTAAWSAGRSTPPRAGWIRTNRRHRAVPRTTA
jgi:hypothetical protein